MTPPHALLLLWDIQVSDGEFKWLNSRLQFVSFGSAGSGAIALAHLDGSGTDEAVTAMVRSFQVSVLKTIAIYSLSLLQQVSRVNELALGYPEGRIELQLIGGFRDQQGYAEDLYSNIMRE